MDNYYPIIVDPIRIKPKGDLFLIRNQKTYDYIEVNKTMGQILIECDGSVNVAHVITKLAQKYQLRGKDIASDIHEAVESYIEKGLIQLKDIPGISNQRVCTEDLQYSLDVVYLELTTACNMKCIHCYRDATYSKNSEFTVDWTNIIDQLDHLGVFSVVLTGGEPLLYEGMVDLIHNLYNVQINYQLITNGLLLDDAVISTLISYKPENITISLDGSNRVTYEKIRKVDTYDIVIANIKRAVDAGFRVKLNCVLSKMNMQEVGEIIDIASELGVKSLSFDSLMSYGRAVKGHDLWLEKDEIDVINKMISNKTKQLSSYGRYIPHIPSGNLTEDVLDRNEFVRYPICGVGTSSCLIKANGDIAFCPPLNGESFTAGNICQDSVSYVWCHSVKFNQIRKHSINDIEKCSTCSVKNRCYGGCRARAYDSFGTFLAPDPWSCNQYGKGVCRNVE